ncbi:MAG TPA: hypothetical protein VF701_01920 [Thermoanaerobaculia bacterium]
MKRLSRNLAVLIIAVTLAFSATAQDDALSLVPANAATVGMARLAEMRTSPLSSLLFRHVDKMSTGGEAETFLHEAGLHPLRDVDVIVVATSPRTALGGEADVLVVAEGRFQPERLAAALVSRGAVQKGAYLLFPETTRGSDGETGAVAFLSSSLAIAGNERSVINALAARAGGGTGFTSRGALAMDLGRIDRTATAWALVDVPRAARLTKGGTIDTGSGQPGAALQVALKSVSTVAIWAKDTGATLQLAATGLSNDTETLHLLEDALRGALAALRMVANEKAPEMVPVLRRFDVDRRSDSISVQGSIPAAALHEVMAKKLAGMK